MLKYSYISPLYAYTAGVIFSINLKILLLFAKKLRRYIYIIGLILLQLNGFFEQLRLHSSHCVESLILMLNFCVFAINFYIFKIIIPMVKLSPNMLNLLA